MNMLLNPDTIIAFELRLHNAKPLLTVNYKHTIGTVFDILNHKSPTAASRCQHGWWVRVKARILDSFNPNPNYNPNHKLTPYHDLNTLLTITLTLTTTTTRSHPRWYL